MGACQELHLAVHHHRDQAVGVGLEELGAVARAVEPRDGATRVDLEEILADLEPVLAQQPVRARRARGLRAGG